jgi:hypothetical protein
MKQLTEQDIQQFVAEFEQKSKLPVELVTNPELRLYMASARAISNYLGPNWGETYVLNGPLKAPFLRLHRELGLLDLRHVRRIISLAEMLFNLQTVEGIEGRMAQICNDDIEATIAELEVARLLYWSKIPFRFIIPRGVKGLDYDIEIILPWTKVACEMKCKIDSTDLNEKTMKETLNQARSQIPTTMPGVIFVKIPERWIFDEKIAHVMRNTLDKFFRNSGRVATVFFLWEELHDRADGNLMHITRIRPDHNKHARIPLPGLTSMFYKYFASPDLRPKWIYFRDIVRP